jgi:hypothetical protein
MSGGGKSMKQASSSMSGEEELTSQASVGQT